MIVGKRKPGASPVELATNTKRVSRFAFPDGVVSSLKVYLDGQGSGAGSGPVLLRPVIYSAANALVAAGDELSLPSGAAGAWHDLTFWGASPGGAVLAAGDYDIGVHVGGATLTARVFQDVPDGLGGRWNADTYSGGPADPFGSSTALTGRFAVVAQPFAAWAAPSELEVWYGRLPFDEAQRVFASSGPRPGSRLASCAWHGTGLDPERGSFVVVKAGGKFDPWVGERVRITSRVPGPMRGASVYGFIHNALDIDDDLSVTRRMFLGLDLPGLDRIDVSVGLMR